MSCCLPTNSERRISRPPTSASAKSASELPPPPGFAPAPALPVVAQPARAAAQPRACAQSRTIQELSRRMLVVRDAGARLAGRARPAVVRDRRVVLALGQVLGEV